jgi:hypothetical protein
LSAPPPTHPARVHSRDRDPLGTRNRWLRRAVGRRHHPSSLVPSSSFLTTSTVSSARRTAGLLHPAAGPGVRRVSRDPLPPVSRGWPSDVAKGDLEGSA